MRLLPLNNLDASTAAYLAQGLANGGTISAANLDRVDTFIRGLKSDGVWPRISDLGILCGWDNLAGAITPLKTSAGITSLSNTAFVSTDYIASGANCGINTYDQLRYNASYGGETVHLLHAGAVSWQTNAAMGIHGGNGPSGGSNWIYDSGGFPVIYWQTPTLYFGAYGYGGTDFIGATKRTVGDATVNRISSSSLKGYQAGSEVATVSGASSGTPNAGNLVVCAGRGGSSRLYYYAPGFSAADYALLYARCNTLLTALGVGSSHLSLHYEGDSLTQGFGVTPYSTYLSAKAAWAGRQVNVGRSSETIVTMNSQYVSQAQFMKPDSAVWTKGIIFIWAGTNDLAASDLATTVLTNLRTYWAAARADGFKVVAFTVTPRNDGAWSGAKETQRLALNVSIATDSANWDALIDASAAFPTYSDTTYYQGDQLHLNSNGNSHLADVIDGQINPATF